MIPVISPIHSIASCDAICSERRDRFKDYDFDNGKDSLQSILKMENVLRSFSPTLGRQQNSVLRIKTGNQRYAENNLNNKYLF